VLCHSGGRSARVAEFLGRQGFARVANIEGGIDAWSRDCDPTISRY
jgi:rhodanese-related sulfurtransferase